MLASFGSPLGIRRETRKSKPWAVLLFLLFVLTLLIELAMIQFLPGEDGKWIATMAEEPQLWVAFLMLGTSVISLLGGMVFTFLRWRERNIMELIPYQGITGTDLIYTCAWLQFLQTAYLFAYEFLLPEPLFAKGSTASLLESASLQFFILTVAFFRFRGRAEAIGLSWPRRPGKMMAAVGLLFVLIIFMLPFVSDPFSEWLHLSPESEREQDIEQEILLAKGYNLLNLLVGTAVIGLIVPFAEELLFRGVIQTYLVKRWGAFAGIGVSSFWFALLHVDIAQFIPLLLIGVVLGFVRHRYRSLWGAVLLHSMNNLMSLLVYF